MAIAMTIAGSDPSGGAGIQADLKVFAAQGVYGVSVTAALTAQNTLGVTDAIGVPAAFVRAQFRALAEDLAPQALKTGMLFNAEIVRTVAQSIGSLRRAATPQGMPVPLVVDPVLASSAGFSLMEEEGREVYLRELIPLATVLMPNLDEAALLLGSDALLSGAARRDACRRLRDLGCHAVYLKGGHLPGGDCLDLFYDGEFLELSAPRVESANTHGTGCALSAALAANLARGMQLRAAAKDAKDYVQGALLAAKSRTLGHGAGPLEHDWRRVT